MPKKPSVVSINLLPSKQKNFGDKFIQWSLTYGRYIIIGTEIIVLLAFLSRFKLDREYIDLKDEVVEKQKILTALAPVEKNVLQLQNRIESIKKADDSQSRALAILPLLASTTPTEVTFKKITVVGNKITIVGLTKETAYITQFVTNLKSISLFKQDGVALENVERGKEDGDLLRFTVVGTMEGVKQ
jgi:Tfp pilus assembly protein PilN